MKGPLRPFTPLAIAADTVGLATKMEAANVVGGEAAVRVRDADGRESLAIHTAARGWGSSDQPMI